MRSGGQTTVIQRVLERRANQPPALEEDTTSTIAVMLRVLPPPRAVLAIGDSQFLLFHRGDKAGYQLRGAFPLERPEDFSLNPATLLTRRDPRLATLAWNKREATRVPLQSGDVIVLATDSVAKWLMTQALQEQRPAPSPLAGPAGDPNAVGSSGDLNTRGGGASSGAHIERYVADWATILTTRDQGEFERLVHREIHAGRMDEDDVTVVVIPIE